MPPMEWPTRMVCTEGSMVGRRCGVCDFDVDDFVQKPERLVRKRILHD